MKLPLLCLCVLLAPLYGLGDQDVSTLVEALRSDSFSQREAAHRKLLEGSENQHDAMLKLLLPAIKDRNADPEFRMRASRLAERVFELTQFEEKDGFIGIGIARNAIFDDDNPAPTVRVNHVMPDTMGARAGLEMGDDILEIDGQRFDNTNDPVTQFMRRIGYTRPGHKIDLLVVRNEARLKISVELMQRPKDVRRGLYDREEDLELSFEAWLEEQNQTP